MGPAAVGTLIAVFRDGETCTSFVLVRAKTFGSGVCSSRPFFMSGHCSDLSALALVIAPDLRGNLPFVFEAPLVHGHHVDSHLHRTALGSPGNVMDHVNRLALGQA